MKRLTATLVFVFAMLLGSTVFAADRGEFVTEVKTNSAGMEYTIRYEKGVEMSESDIENLSRFIGCESGNDEEKRIIADIIVKRLNSDLFPDNVKDIILQEHQFFFDAEYWNNYKVLDEDIEIAETAYYAKELSKFDYYLYNIPDAYEICNQLLSDCIEIKKTDYYLFLDISSEY